MRTAIARALSSEAGESTLQLEEDVGGKVLEASFRKRAELLTRLVAFGMEVFLWDEKVGGIGWCSMLVLPTSKFIVNVGT